MTLLIAAIAGLCLGPLLFALLHRSEAPQLAVDGFVLIAVVGLVMLHVLPDAFEVAGIWALLAAGVGLFLPLVVEKVRALSHHASHGLVLAVAFLALMLHASLDGVGLGGSEGLGIAVVLHRIPVGLGVWWLVRPQFGRRWAFAVLAALCAATVLGWSLQASVIEPEGVLWVQVMQALVAGSLLHVLLHQSVGFHAHAERTSPWHVPGAIGAILGAMLVAALPDAHHAAFGDRILDITFLASPFLVALYAIAAAVRRDRAWPMLDASAPWVVGAVVLAAMLGHMHVEPSVLQTASAVTLGALIVASLVHQGPREFLLVVLPLDLIQSGHDHDEHDHAHGAVAEPTHS